MFLGVASGKVGSTVFYRADGEQRTRVLVTPKNPRSRAQMQQRVKIANAAAIYRAAKAVLSRSFEVRKGNESSYNAFTRGAMAIPAYLTKEMVQLCLAIPQPAQASRGTLGSIPWQLSPNGENWPIIRYQADDEPTTVGDFSALVLAISPTLQNGDVITFADIHFEERPDTGLEYAYTASLRYVDVTLDTESSATLASVGLKATGLSNSLTVEPEWALGIDAMAAADAPTAMRAIIASRKDEDGKLRVSSQNFGLSMNAYGVFDDNHGLAAMNAAIDSYGVAADVALAD